MAQAPPRTKLRRFLEKRQGFQFTLGVLLAAMMVFCLVGAGLFKVVAHGSGDVARAGLRESAGRAAKYDGEGRADEALAEYRRALGLVEGRFDFRSEAAMIRGQIRELERRKGWMTEADREWASYQARHAVPQNRDHGLFIDGVLLYHRYGHAGIRWAGDLMTTLVEFPRDERAFRAGTPWKWAALQPLCPP